MSGGVMNFGLSGFPIERQPSQTIGSAAEYAAQTAAIPQALSPSQYLQADPAYNSYRNDMLAQYQSAYNAAGIPWTSSDYNTLYNNFDNLVNTNGNGWWNGSPAGNTAMAATVGGTAFDNYNNYVTTGLPAANQAYASQIDARQKEAAEKAAQQQAAQAAYGQQTGGGFTGGIMGAYAANPSAALSSTGTTGGASPFMDTTMGSLGSFGSPWTTPGYNGGIGGLGGYNPNPWSSLAGQSPQTMGGPFSNKNPFALGT